MQLESNAVEAIASAASAITSVTKSRKRKGKPLTRKKSSKRSSLSSTGILDDGSSSGSSNSNSNSNSTLDVTHAGNVAMSYDVATIDLPGKGFPFLFLDLVTEVVADAAEVIASTALLSNCIV